MNLLRSIANRFHKKTAIVVIGARSGSSAMGGVLGLLGCKLPARLLAANWANVMGYFEPEDILVVHDEILASVGSCWSDPKAFPDSWFNSAPAKTYREKLKVAFADNYGTAHLMMLKEPRLCRILPLWKRVFADLHIRPVYCFIDRDPMEVAASLHDRDGSTIEQGLQYYIRNHLDAERDTRGSPRVFVSYDMLLKDWREVIGRIEKQLAVRFHITDEACKGVDNFLNNGLRNQKNTVAPREDALTQLAFEVHRAFSHLAELKPEKPIARTLDDARTRFDAMA